MVALSSAELKRMEDLFGSPGAGSNDDALAACSPGADSSEFDQQRVKVILDEFDDEECEGEVAAEDGEEDGEDGEDGEDVAEHGVSATKSKEDDVEEEDEEEDGEEDEVDGEEEAATAISLAADEEDEEDGEDEAERGEKKSKEEIKKDDFKENKEHDKEEGKEDDVGKEGDKVEDEQGVNENEDAVEDEDEEEDEVSNEKKEAGAIISLAALPPAHLQSLHAHVCKANAAGFFTSDSNIVPLQLPLKTTDGSIAYVLIARRLSPGSVRIARSRSGTIAPIKEAGAITMGLSTVDIDGIRCRLVANMLVHASTALARIELQAIFGTQSWRSWLAILDNPDFPALVLEPVQNLQRIEDATEAEVKHFAAPLDASGNKLQSRGAQHD
jgi:hypothetical protein